MQVNINLLDKVVWPADNRHRSLLVPGNASFDLGVISHVAGVDVLLDATADVELPVVLVELVLKLGVRLLVELVAATGEGWMNMGGLKREEARKFTFSR